MNKNKKNIVFIIIMILVILFVLTGCGSNKLKSNKDITEWLKESYTDERFEIISKEKIKLEARASSGAISKGEGYSYNIKSKDTDIEFIVKDTYRYISGGFPIYGVSDDYIYKATQKYINDYGDERLYLEEKYNDVNINVKTSDFSSYDEMIKLLYNFKNYITTKKPFSYSKGAKYNTYYYILDDNGEQLAYCSLDKINSIDDIYKCIESYK